MGFWIIGSDDLEVYYTKFKAKEGCPCPIESAKPPLCNARMRLPIITVEQEALSSYHLFVTNIMHQLHLAALRNDKLQEIHVKERYRISDGMLLSLVKKLLLKGSQQSKIETYASMMFFQESLDLVLELLRREMCGSELVQRIESIKSNKLLHDQQQHQHASDRVLSKLNDKHEKSVQLLMERLKTAICYYRQKGEEVNTIIAYHQREQRERALREQLELEKAHKAEAERKMKAMQRAEEAKERNKRTEKQMRDMLHSDHHHEKEDKVATSGEALPQRHASLLRFSEDTRKKKTQSKVLVQHILG